MIPLQLAAARLMAAKKRPYFSTALFSMTPVERKGLNTLSVDQRWRVYYDPIVFDCWSIEELAGVLIHEVSHLLREHGERRAEVGADEKLWNTAADLEINSTLLGEDLILPSEGVFPVKLGLPEGLLAEEYYERLKAEQQKESEKPAEQSSQNDSNDCEPNKANEPQTQDNQEDSQQDNKPNQSSEESQSNSSEGNSQEDSSDESKTASTSDESSLGDNNTSDDSSGSNSGSNDSSNSEGTNSSSTNQGDKGTTQPASEGDTHTDDSTKRESSTDVTSNESDLSGDSNGSSGDKATTANTETNSQSSTPADEGDEAQTSSPRPSCGSCGSCATGISQEFEDEVDEECPGLSPIEVAKTKQDTARHILQASGRGTVPAGWVRWAEKQASPKVNWRKELAASVRRSISDTVGMTDYSYARPSRRQSAFPEIVMPGMRKPNLLISVVIDTSGSITDVLVGQILKEVELILKTTGQEQVQIITCDSKVHFNKKVRKVSDIKFLGGGGTDMRVGIQTALESKPRPQIIIVITDGATPWPPASPKNTKVVVALLGNSYGSCVPSWAKKIIVS